jgi:dTDP-4-amino-4,6-dideoxy-D-galactose acyltransferase
MSEVVPLIWDSEFLGLKVGKIKLEDVEAEVLARLLQVASENFQLIYCFVTKPDSVPSNLLSSYNGLLADRKVTYKCEFESVGPTSSSVSVLDLVTDEYSKQLVELSLVSGRHSRFRTDSRFPDGTFEKLYTLWMQRSVNKEIADQIFVERRDNLILGMMTVSWINDQAVIGLLAVRTDHHGKNIGTHLVLALKDECLKRGIKQIQVSTQESNIGACAFYRKNEFFISEQVDIFHFWL